VFDTCSAILIGHEWSTAAFALVTLATVIWQAVEFRQRLDDPLLHHSLVIGQIWPVDALFQQNWQNRVPTADVVARTRELGQLADGTVGAIAAHLLLKVEWRASGRMGSLFASHFESAVTARLRRESFRQRHAREFLLVVEGNPACVFELFAHG